MIKLLKPKFQTIDRLEFEKIVDCIEKHQGDIRKISDELDVGIKTLYRKMVNFGLIITERLESVRNSKT